MLINFLCRSFLGCGGRVAENDEACLANVCMKYETSINERVQICQQLISLSKSWRLETGWVGPGPQKPALSPGNQKQAALSSLCSYVSFSLKVITNLYLFGISPASFTSPFKPFPTIRGGDSGHLHRLLDNSFKTILTQYPHHSRPTRQDVFPLLTLTTFCFSKKSLSLSLACGGWVQSNLILPLSTFTLSSKQ